MGAPTLTPNIGLQVPAYNQPNWQVPVNYDLNLLDLMLGGVIPMPALANFVITNLGAQIAANATSEAPAGVVPGNSYVLSKPLNFIFSFCWNGAFQRPSIDYTVTTDSITSVSTITMTNATASGDSVWVVYI